MPPCIWMRWVVWVCSVDCPLAQGFESSFDAEWRSKCWNLRGFGAEWGWECCVVQGSCANWEWQCWSLPACLSKMCRPEASLHQSARDLIVSSSLAGPLAKVFLQKLGGNSSENVCQERVRKFCGKFAKFLGDFQTNFCNDPFPNDPLSEWLTLMISSKSTGECTWDDWSMSGNTSHGTSHIKYRIRCHCHHKQCWP